MLRSTLLTWLSLAVAASAQGDLAGLLSTQPDLSTLLDLITLTGLNETLSTSTNITIVAPTNSAFEALAQMDIPEGTALVERDVAAIEALLSNHVWRGYYPSSEITDVPTFVQSLVTPDQENDVQSFTDISGGQYNGIIQNGSGLALIAGELSVSNVVTADINLGNGVVIHTIDKALMFGPPLELFLARAQYTGLNGALTTLQQDGIDLVLGIEGNNSESALSDITVFIPINEAFESVASVLETANSTTLGSVVAYHLLTDNIVFSPSLGNISATTAEGTDLTFTVFDDGTIFVNNARIIFPNVILSNGVGHIIDSVLNPLNTSIDRDTLSPAAPAEERVQFAGASSASIPFTTFAFTEAAAETYSTPALLSTASPVAVTAGPSIATTATTTAAPPVFTGAANLAQPCVTALAAVAGGFLLAAV